METPLGLPSGNGSQPSSGRPSVDMPSSSRPQLATTDSIGQLWSIPGHHQTPSDSLLAPPLSTAEVVALAREAMRDALEENKTKAGAVTGMSSELKPGITIDMSHKNIKKFPEEVVDIIKTELERLALSHNRISEFPARFAECTSLRYLNVRNNSIREFPLAICELTSLEILDISRNRLRSLPADLSKLTALKVLSVQKNRIEELPLCLGDMTTLQCLKLDGNPVIFPPREILKPQANSPPVGLYMKNDVEAHDMTVTAQIKKFLKQKLIQDSRSGAESGGEELSEGNETPRPLKRVMSGRFPIKVSGSDTPDARSPSLPRPPPIPSRSHYRGLSQQNAALRRPGIMPLTMGNSNERLRSNSESLLQRDRNEKIDRSRRMGIIPKRADLRSVAESKTNRYSHLRGLSHGSALQNGGAPTSPADSLNGRSTYVRRLSSLPERKRQSDSPDAVVEAAKGILFALAQVHPLIESLMGLTRDGENKRSSLERVFFNATTHVEELDRDIQHYDTYTEEDEEVAPRSNAQVHRACVTCVSAYIHVCSLLSRNVESLLNNGDSRYIRKLLLQMYGSLVEVRNAGAALFPAPAKPEPQLSAVPEIPSTIRPILVERDNTPTKERPKPPSRLRSATVVQHSSNLKVMTDSRAAFINGTGRSATMTSATPRSGESFASISSSGIRTAEFTEEDKLFERIFLGLNQSSEMAIRTLPTVYDHFLQGMKQSMAQGNHDQLKHNWALLGQKCQIALQTAEQLKAKLSTVQLKDPSVRKETALWELCNAFISAYYNLVVKVKEVKSITPLLGTDVISLLRPLQKVLRETSQMIGKSPWSYLAGQGQSTSRQNSVDQGQSEAYAVQSPVTQMPMPMPMTPASAALGPAVQATFPSGPPSATGFTSNPMFQGNVFERADALMSMSNMSAFSSRAGTMTSNATSAWNSSASTVYGADSVPSSAASTLSPNGHINSHMPRYGSGKVTF